MNSASDNWNLVGAEWWRKWCDYVDMDPKNGSPHGSLPVPLIPPNTVVEVARNIRGNIALRAGSFGGETAGNHSPRPGPIANWSLLMQSGCRRLKEKLVLARDFYMIPSPVYAVLFTWYSGGPDLVRSIVEVPTKAEPELQIELFPLVLRVARVDPANGSVIRSGEEVLLSELSTPASLLEATCRALQLFKLMDKARLWYFNEKMPEHKIRLRDEYSNELRKLTQDSVFLLEVQDDDGSWPLSQTNDTITSSPLGSSIRQPTQSTGQVSENDTAGSTSRKRQREHRPSLRTSDICSRGNLGESLAQRGSDGGSPTIEVDPVLASPVVRKRFSKDAFKGPGLVGLDNLGNTCYMSSALQCLSHTRLLVEYFKNEAYLKDINLRNRDGTNGKLTAAFGELLRVLWTSDRKRFAPNEFKKVLAKCSPQFAGSDQHDAQELLACLLSSLSEDLNRVVKKPYTEQPDSDGRPDALVAEEWWQNHQKREFSVIVALFTGQYKSLLECSVCRYESARFEPFTFLQLSLPESSSRSIVLTIIFRTDRVPLRFSVRVQNGDTVQHMKEQVAAFLKKIERESGIPNSTEEQDNLEEKSLNEGDWTKVVIARTSSLHTVESLLDDKLPLTQIHEKDQLTAFELDREEDLLPPDSQETDLLQETNRSATQETADTSQSRFTKENASNAEDENRKTATAALINGASSSKEDGSVTSNPTQGNVQEANEESEHEDEDEVLPLETSVYVRIDKTKELVAARVIGSSANSGTINVAYPSGVRRYHIPLSKVIERRQSDAFVFLVHRRVERSTDSFTNAHITRLFGAPLVIRVSLRVTTAYNLYMLVWNRLRRIFNWLQPPPPSDFDAKTRSRKKLRTDASSLALGEHLPLTKFGFCLRLVTSHGIGCSRCEWIEGCLGCVLYPSSTTVIPLAAEETVAIDWDIRTLKEEYDPIQASKMDFDASVQRHQRQDNQPLNLAHCMEMFTAKETIPEAYCGHCKTLRPATKKMDLWRLPPLLVIHLKRFCFTQVSRRKLHHLVDFPLKGLQFDDFVARKREARGRLSGLEYWLFLGGKLRTEPSKDKPESPPVSGSSKQTRPGSPRRVSSSVLDAPASATAAVRGDDGFLYDLYAVVNHVGALGGGHYFAYVLSDHDGKWKCFNDHQCKDIDEKEVVSSMAYILFYRRRDTAQMTIEQLFPPQPLDATGNGSSTEEEAASDKAQVEELLQQSKLASSTNLTPTLGSFRISCFTMDYLSSSRNPNDQEHLPSDTLQNAREDSAPDASSPQQQGADTGASWDEESDYIDAEVSQRSRKKQKVDTIDYQSQIDKLQKEIAEMKAKLDSQQCQATNPAYAIGRSCIEAKQTAAFMKRKLAEHTHWLQRVSSLMETAPLFYLAAPTANDEESKRESKDMDSQKRLQQRLQSLDEWKEESNNLPHPRLILDERLRAAVSVCQENAASLLRDARENAPSFQLSLKFQSYGWDIATGTLMNNHIGFRCHRLLPAKLKNKAQEVAVAMWNFIECDEVFRTFIPLVQDSKITHRESNCSLSCRVLLLSQEIDQQAVATVESLSSMRGDGQEDSWQISMEAVHDHYLCTYVADASDDSVLHNTAPPVKLDLGLQMSKLNMHNKFLMGTRVTKTDKGVDILIAGSAHFDLPCYRDPTFDLLQHFVSHLPVYEDLHLTPLGECSDKPASDMLCE
ncbi:unnamed protein product [Phytophthora lilii]|uniref:ubiquitinyl hydrolase 1 n=1 Tax=Phytophthora lilii TaxID=2077276 RepID=A0A9W6X4J9_9STRA|nr:unnamed protein product [Phytophthora lilii]